MRLGQYFIFNIGSRRWFKKGRCPMQNKIKVGDLIEIIGNSDFATRGIPIVTGKITWVHKDGRGFTFKCIETNNIECCDINDGKLNIL